MVGMVPLVFALVGSAGVIVALLLGWNALRARREVMREALGRRLGAIGPAPVEEEDLLRRITPGAPGWMGSRFGPWLELLLRSAGRSDDPKDFLLRAALLGGASALLLMAILRSPLGIVGLGVGWLPILLLQREGSKRGVALSAQLPDALDLVARTLRAGHAFTDALRIAAAELPEPLALELGTVAEENRLGRDLRESLDQLLARNPTNFDLRLFSGSVLLQRETGGNLIEMLDHLSRTIRERIIFEEKVEALTAEVRFSALILTAMPFLVAGAILVVKPDYLTPLFETTLGRLILFGAMTSLGIGVVVMRRLATVEA